MSFDARVSRVLIPNLGTDAACLETLAYMREVVRSECGLPICVQCARDIAECLWEFTPEGYVEACYGFVKRFMTFREDHVSFAERFGRTGDNVEYLQAPSFLLHQENPKGDCDCYCMLLATLLRIGDVPCSFVVISQPDSPGSFSHVYVAAYPNGRRVALDASHGDYLGWEYPDTVRIYELPV